MKIQLKESDVVLAVKGARAFQEDGENKLSFQQRALLDRGEPFLLHSGAKLYRAGKRSRNNGSWWVLNGYGYAVRTNHPKYESLPVDAQDTLRTLGFAV